MQSLMVVGLIVEEILSFDVKCVKGTGAQNIGQGQRVKIPAELVHLGEARENRKNSRSGPKLRILDRFQTPQNANKSVQQVCALNPIFPPTNQFSRINDV